MICRYRTPVRSLVRGSGRPVGVAMIGLPDRSVGLKTYCDSDYIYHSNPPPSFLVPIRPAAIIVIVIFFSSIQQSFLSSSIPQRSFHT
jgi:hypothetical protein